MQVFRKPYSVEWIRAEKKSGKEYVLDILISGDNISEDIRVEVRQISIENKERDFQCTLTEKGLIAVISRVIDNHKDKKAACFSFPLSKEEFDSINDKAKISFIVKNVSVSKHTIYKEEATMEKGEMKKIKAFAWNPKKQEEELKRKRLKKKQEKQN